ncbi:hypothetical protein ACS0TY_024339 [Phlomoides rotata]
MAAYAALGSLINNIEQIQNHPRLSTSFDRNQIKSLLQMLDFLLDFIENYTTTSYRGSKDEELYYYVLERQIASAAHAAEDVIESHIVDQILSPSSDEGSSFLVKVLEKMQLRKPCALRLKLHLRKILKDMDSIKEKAIKVKEERQFERAIKVKEEERGCRVESPNSSMATSSQRTHSAGKSNMVGFNGYLTHLLEELTGHQSDRKIIPIVGMGGIGKTTLARNTYDNLLVVHHFDVRAWVRVSQRYNVRRILVQTLSCLGKSNVGMDEETEHELRKHLHEKTENELGEQLHKTLSGMRYLIILDDMWSTDVWDEIKFFFPNNCNRSRIIVTTRMHIVADHFGSTRLALKFLDDFHSWELFCEKVFLEGICPPELEKSGRKIVKRCQGLPLAIVVIGGLLAKSSMTEDQWKNVGKDMRSILKTAEDNRCSKLLTLSYSHLPACLKPCFLYMGTFPEDDVIRVSRLIRLWVAEGFIKPNKVESLEEIGEGYIKDLVGRNLISVHSLRWDGNVKTCYIHDLLRDLCVTVAEEEKFLCATSLLDTQKVDKQRRIIIRRSTAEEKYNPHFFCSLKSKSLARSLICKGGDLLQAKPRLLRVLIEVYSESIDDIFLQVNLRFLAHESQKAPIGGRDTYHLPSSISLLWNVQTLIMTGVVQEVVAPSQIWNMPQLRHLKFKSISLPDPSPTDGSVLHNLQTLGNLHNFRFTEDACKRIPNIKKLHVSYGEFSRESVRWSDYCLHNLILLEKLEYLHYHFIGHTSGVDLSRSLVFPGSLKKLTLVSCELEWNDLTVFGRLPRLEALKLRFSGSGPNWYPVKRQFFRLKYLQIYRCNLVCWNADSSHFPALEKLVLEHLDELVEIPSGVGDIDTLERICVVNCSVSAALSAVRILEEQESLGNQDLQVKVDFHHNKPKLEEFMEQLEVEGLSGTNVQIEGR